MPDRAVLAAKPDLIGCRLPSCGHAPWQGCLPALLALPGALQCTLPRGAPPLPSRPPRPPVLRSSAWRRGALEVGRWEARMSSSSMEEAAASAPGASPSPAAPAPAACMCAAASSGTRLHREGGGREGAGREQGGSREGAGGTEAVGDMGSQASKQAYSAGIAALHPLFAPDTALSSRRPTSTTRLHCGTSQHPPTHPPTQPHSHPAA